MSPIPAALWAALPWVVVWLGLRYIGHVNVSKVIPIVGVVVFSLGAAPLAAKIGTDQFRQGAVAYREFWNGWETAALVSSTTCTKNGWCSLSYQCDPHDVTEFISVTDADGKGSHMEARVHTEYDDCPYATEERSYAVATTLGKYGMGTFIAPGAVEWRAGSGFGGYPVGPPAEWVAVADRIAAGDPGPVTADKGYDNYVLSSQHTILRKHEQVVNAYAKLLPPPTAGWKSPIRDLYHADKVSFVGLPEPKEWAAAVERLNAALGTELQGDLHLVAVDARRVVNPAEYTIALAARWQSPDVYGRRALSKNGIGIVIGVRERRVAWARMFTGMPVGNEALQLDVRDMLIGKAFTVATLIGKPTARVLDDGNVKVTPGQGALPRLLWGPHRFQRVCMACDDPGDRGAGYRYLINEIRPSRGARWLVDFIVLLLSVVACAAVHFAMPYPYLDGGESPSAVPLMRQVRRAQANRY